MNLTGTDHFGVLGLHERIVFKIIKEIGHEVVVWIRGLKIWTSSRLVQILYFMKQNQFKLSTDGSYCFTLVEVSAGVQNIMLEICTRLWLAVLPTDARVGNAWIYTSTPAYLHGVLSGLIIYAQRQLSLRLLLTVANICVLLPHRHIITVIILCSFNTKFFVPLFNIPLVYRNVYIPVSFPES